MTTTASTDRHGRGLVLLLAAVLTFAVTVVLGLVNAVPASAATPSSAGISSASSAPAAQTRVGASTTAAVLFVEGSASIAAGQRRDKAPSQRQFVSGCCVAAEDAAGGSSRLVIGRTSDLQAPGAMGPGEYNLLDQLPNQGSPQVNWAQNSTVLRQALRNGVTQIRDASPGDTGGQFLNAERNLLENRGWTFDPSTSMWNAP